MTGSLIIISFSLTYPIVGTPPDLAIVLQPLDISGRAGVRCEDATAADLLQMQQICSHADFSGGPPQPLPDRIDT